ncbi:MAG: hypothetical protein ACOCWG_01435 [bacterium]
MTVLWIFFRSNSMEKAKLIFSGILDLDWNREYLEVSWKIWFFLSLFIISDVLFFKRRFDHWCFNKPFIVRWIIYAFLLFSIIVFSGVEQFPFIYFQF